MLFYVKIAVFFLFILSQMVFERTKNWARASTVMWMDTRGLEKTFAIGFSGLYGIYNVIDYIASTPLAVTATILATETLAHIGIFPHGIDMTTILSQHGASSEFVTNFQEITGKVALAGVGAQAVRRSALRFIPHAGQFINEMGHMAKEDYSGYRRRY